MKRGNAIETIVPNNYYLETKSKNQPIQRKSKVGKVRSETADIGEPETDSRRSTAERQMDDRRRQNASADRWRSRGRDKDGETKARRERACSQIEAFEILKANCGFGWVNCISVMNPVLEFHKSRIKIDRRLGICDQKDNNGINFIP